MAYKGGPFFQQQELTPVRRMRESGLLPVDAGGPGSGPRGGKSTPSSNVQKRQAFLKKNPEHKGSDSKKEPSEFKRGDLVIHNNGKYGEVKKSVGQHPSVVDEDGTKRTWHQNDVEMA